MEEERSPTVLDNMIMNNNGTCTIHSTEQGTFESHGEWLLANAYMSMKSETFGCFLLVGGTGKPVGMHKTVLLRFSKWIQDLYEENPSMLTISLDFATEHILKKFIMMLYGYTVMSDKEQLQQIKSVFQQLAIPFNQSSFDVFLDNELIYTGPDTICFDFGNHLIIAVGEERFESQPNGVTHQNAILSPPLILDHNSNDNSTNDVFDNHPITHEHHGIQYGSDEHPDQFVSDDAKDLHIQNSDKQDAPDQIHQGTIVEDSDQSVKECSQGGSYHEEVEFVTPALVNPESQTVHGSNHQELELDTQENSELQIVNTSTEKVGRDETSGMEEPEIPDANVSRCVQLPEELVVTKLLTKSEYEDQKKLDDPKPLHVFKDEDVKEMIKRGSISICKLGKYFMKIGMTESKSCEETTVTQKISRLPDSEMPENQSNTTQNVSDKPQTLNAKKPKKRKYEKQIVVVGSVSGIEAELEIAVPNVDIYVDDDGNLMDQENGPKIENVCLDVRPAPNGANANELIGGIRCIAIEEALNEPKRKREADQSYTNQQPSTSSGTDGNKPEAASKRGRPRKYTPKTKPESTIHNQPKPTTREIQVSTDNEV